MPAQRPHRDHVQGRRHALARNVADEKGQAARGAFHEIVEIARHLPGRKDPAEDLEVGLGKAFQLVGQVALLNLVPGPVPASIVSSRNFSACSVTFSSTTVTSMPIAVKRCRSSTRNPKPWAYAIDLDDAEPMAVLVDERHADDRVQIERRDRMARRVMLVALQILAHEADAVVQSAA